VVTDSEQVTDKTSTEPLQNSATGTFTECYSEQHQTDSQHQLGANMVHVNGDDPELALLIQAWPELSEHIKAAIKTLIQTQNKP
jgi:2-oxoglutarate dehydrogenase complex dehydrogenase (E1) component-like enzyme